MICPHCEGTGYSTGQSKPLYQINGKNLSPRESEIVSFLAEKNGTAIPVQRIANHLGEIPKRSVHVFMWKIRRKIPGLIITHPWHGYALNMEFING